MLQKKGQTLTDFPLAQGAKFVEQNLIQWTKLKGLLPNVELRCDSDVMWTFSTIKGRPNHVCAPRFEPETVEVRLDEVLAYYRRHRAAVSWWIGPSATPADLRIHLRSHGLSCRKHAPGMAIDLNRLSAVNPERRDLTCDVIEDLSIFDKFEHPSIGRTSTTHRAMEIDDKRRLVRMKPRCVWDFMASLKGEPVGVATLFVGASVAGIYDVTVLPKARGQGVGTALTVALLQFARSLGNRVAILLASKNGENIYRKIGFKCVCTISHWYYPKSISQLMRRGTSTCDDLLITD